MMDPHAETGGCSLRERIYRLLCSEGCPMTYLEVAARLGEPHKVVSDALRRLSARGLLSRAEGRWRAIQPPTPPLFGTSRGPRNTRPTKEAPGAWLTQADRDWLAYWSLPREVRRQQPPPS